MATPQIQNDPVYSLPHLYISGAKISVASTTLLALAPGAVRDVNNVIDMQIGNPNLENITYPAPLFINSALLGANGVDQGTIAASSTYSIYVIGDSRYYLPTAGIISLTSNAFPLLPFGYDSYRLLGFILTDSSSHFLAANLINTYTYQNYYLQPPVSVLSGGTATSFTAINLSSAIPTGMVLYPIAFLTVNYTPALAGNTVQFRQTGSSATSGLITITGIAAGVSQTNQIQIITGNNGTVPEIDYKVTSSDSVSVLVSGYSATPVAGTYP